MSDKAHTHQIHISIMQYLVNHAYNNSMHDSSLESNWLASMPKRHAQVYSHAKHLTWCTQQAYHEYYGTQHISFLSVCHIISAIYRIPPTNITIKKIKIKILHAIPTLQVMYLRSLSLRPFEPACIPKIDNPTARIPIPPT